MDGTFELDAAEVGEHHAAFDHDEGLGPQKGLARFLSFEGCESYARLRRRWQLTDRASLVLGADVRIHPTSDVPIPVFEFAYDVELGGSGSGDGGAGVNGKNNGGGGGGGGGGGSRGTKVGTLRLNRRRAYLERTLAFECRGVRAELDAAVGLSYSGQPQAGVALRDIQPWPVVVAAAAVLLAAKHTLHGRKTFGRFDIDVPLFGVQSSSRVEGLLSAAARREPPLRVHQLNPVIWAAHEGSPLRAHWLLGPIGEV